MTEHIMGPREAAVPDAPHGHADVSLHFWVVAAPCQLPAGRVTCNQIYLCLFKR